MLCGRFFRTEFTHLIFIRRHDQRQNKLLCVNVLHDFQLESNIRLFAQPLVLKGPGQSGQVKVLSGVNIK